MKALSVWIVEKGYGTEWWPIAHTARALKGDAEYELRQKRRNQSAFDGIMKYRLGKYVRVAK